MRAILTVPRGFYAEMIEAINRARFSDADASIARISPKSKPGDVICSFVSERGEDFGILNTIAENYEAFVVSPALSDDDGNYDYLKYRFTVDLIAVDYETGEVLYETSFMNQFASEKEARQFVDRQIRTRSKGTYDEYRINRVCYETDYEEIVYIRRSH